MSTLNQPHDDLTKRTDDALRAFASAPSLGAALFAMGQANLRAFASQPLMHEQRLEEAAREAMLKEVFEGVPGFTPTAKELQHMADMDAEKHSEGHRHRNTREQRHE